MSDAKERKPISFIVFLIFWLVVISLAFIFFGKELGYGVIVAAVISGVLWHTTLNSQYSGVVEKFEIKKYHQKGRIDREQKFAVLRLDNGKKKKIIPMPDWKVGDRIVKKKGETMPYLEKK